MGNEQPRQYRVKLIQGDDRDVMRNRPIMVILDLTPGERLAEARRQLDSLLTSLVRAIDARAGADQIQNYHLDVRSWDQDTPEIEWWYSAPADG